MNSRKVLVASLLAIYNPYRWLYASFSLKMIASPFLLFSKLSTFKFLPVLQQKLLVVLAKQP